MHPWASYSTLSSHRSFAAKSILASKSKAKSTSRRIPRDRFRGLGNPDDDEFRADSDEEDYVNGELQMNRIVNLKKFTDEYKNDSETTPMRGGSGGRGRKRRDRWEEGKEDGGGEPSDEWNDESDEERDREDSNHIDEQKRRLVEEIMAREKGQKAQQDEFWPSRPVDIGIEFPSLRDEQVRELHKTGEIDRPDIIQAARYKEREAEKKRRIKQKLLEAAAIPERVRKAIPVNELPSAEKLPAKPKEVNNFSELGIESTGLLKVIYERWGIVKPTSIQTLAIPPLLAGNNVFVAAQTGTGKTLGYLLPVLQRLREMEVEAGATYRRRGQRSRAVIVVPTRELVHQTMRVLGELLLAEDFKHFTSYGMAGGITRDKAEHRGFNKGLDVLVSTADRLVYHLESKHLDLDDTRIVVVDEADTMFSTEVHEESLNALLKFLDRAQETSVQPFAYQFVWASATVSRAVAKHIAHQWPDTVQAFTDDLHRSVDKLQQDFLFGAPGPFRERLLMDTLKKHKGLRTIIFCNSHENAKFVYNLLKKRNYSVALLASVLNAKKRRSNYEEFTEGKLRVLVTTDVASRGLDMRQEVEHVILYDFPSNVIDYLHRIGRTARAGNEGLVTAFVGPKNQSLAQKIREAFEQGRSLANVTDVPTWRKLKEELNIKKKKQQRKQQKPQDIDQTYRSADGSILGPDEFEEAVFIRRKSDPEEEL